MQNSIVVFTFSVFNQKYPFWANLVQKKNKIVSFKYEEFNGDVHFFFFQLDITFFKICSKKLKLFVEAEI